jgi:nicotinamidase-related amidase
MFKISAMIFCALPLFSASVLSQGTTVPPAEEKVTALLIIDIQDFYFPGGAVPLHRPEAASLNAARILEKFRKERCPVIHVGHNAKDKMGFHETVAPRSDEKVFYKSEVSAFNGTELLSYLREQKVRRLVIVGILVEDACATRNLKYKDREVSAEDVHATTLSTLNRAYATVIDTETFLATY